MDVLLADLLAVLRVEKLVEMMVVDSVETRVGWTVDLLVVMTVAMTAEWLVD